MKTSSFFAALLLLSLGTKTGALASDKHILPPKIMAGLIATSESRPPIGWVQFCNDNPRDCQSPRSLQPISAEGPVILDQTAWNELVLINSQVNTAVHPLTDKEHFGVEEKWTYPVNSSGDCEDYVLEKRRQLIDMGWPRSSLLITVVRDKKGDGHAVLTVRTDRGDLILDNQETAILHAQTTGYKFIKRQADWNQNSWVSLNDGQNTVATTAR